ncbi:MAG: hypothetical protein ACP5OG_01440 [Candidatus Nanoarchaeia archaeon]
MTKKISIEDILMDIAIKKAEENENNKKADDSTIDILGDFEENETPSHFKRYFSLPFKDPRAIRMLDLYSEIGQNKKPDYM